MISDNYEYKNSFSDGIPILRSNRIYPCVGFERTDAGIKNISYIMRLKKLVRRFTIKK